MNFRIVGRWSRLAPLPLVFLLLIGCAPKKDAPLLRLEQMKFSELNGATVDVSQFKNKTVFVNVWATWCKPCIQEMPSIQHAKSLLATDEIVFLLASDDESEQIERFKQKHGYDLHYVKLDNLNELSIQALPTTFIFDGDGNLTFTETGYRQWDEPASLQLISEK